MVPIAMPAFAPGESVGLEGLLSKGFSSCCGRTAPLGTGRLLAEIRKAEPVTLVTVRDDAAPDDWRAVGDVTVVKPTGVDGDVDVALAARVVVVDDGKVGVWAIAVKVGMDLVEELKIGFEVEEGATVRKAVVGVAGSSSSSVSVSGPTTSSSLSSMSGSAGTSSLDRRRDRFRCTSSRPSILPRPARTKLFQYMVLVGRVFLIPRFAVVQCLISLPPFIES